MHISCSTEPSFPEEVAWLEKTEAVTSVVNANYREIPLSNLRKDNTFVGFVPEA